MFSNNKGVKEMVMTAQVYEQICKTIGRHKPETGGILGSSDGGKTVDTYYFDKMAVTSGATYAPDTETLNRVIKDWNSNGIELIGIIHSHPSGCIEPSEGDYNYASRIIDAMALTDNALFTPIVQVDRRLNGDIKIYPYTHKKQVVREQQRLQVETEYRQTEIDRKILEERDALAKARFDRIADLYPLSVLKRKTIVCIGSGGARSYLENMARCGIRNFVIFEADDVSATNIATQAVFVSEIGKNKGECIKQHILDINPTATVIVEPRFVDDSMSDEDFIRLTGKNILSHPTDYLIAGCTDNFYSQARSANLSLKYGVPYVAAQLYKGGMASELYFNYPGVTNSSCPRCAMSSRYDAYLIAGAENDITSAGTPIFATERTNATKGFISLMLLLYHEDSCCIFNEMLDKVSDKNFVMIRMNPLLSEKLGINLFDNQLSSEMTFFDETLWIPQTPNNGENGYEVCPLCGGNGNVLALKGKIKDTRIIV